MCLGGVGFFFCLVLVCCGVCLVFFFWRGVGGFVFFCLESMVGILGYFEGIGKMSPIGYSLLTLAQLLSSGSTGLNFLPS